MSQEKIPARELIGFILKVRHLATQEGDERKALQLIRNYVNRMFVQHIGYDHRGDHRLKARGESPFAVSVEARKAYEQRWGKLAADRSPLRISFFGHCAVSIGGTRTVVFDPFVTGNPAHSGRISPLSVTEAHVVCVTQEHPHHLGDALALCARTGATLVATPPLLASITPPASVRREALNVGGTVSIDGIDVTMTDARHVTAGAPAVGFLVTLDGHTIYDSGDTGLFEGMGLLGEQRDIDLALLPIGGRHTMGVRDAARAVALLRPRYVVPIHYNTYADIQADAEEFLYLVAESAEVKLLSAGESFVIERSMEASGVPTTPEQDHASAGDADDEGGPERAPQPALGGR